MRAEWAIRPGVSRLQEEVREASLSGGPGGPTMSLAQATTKLAAPDPQSGLVNVIIDTPKGSRNKFKYDEELGLFRLSKVLPLGSSFPYDFGFIPGTRGEDGDALDVLVLLDEAAMPG